MYSFLRKIFSKSMTGLHFFIGKNIINPVVMGVLVVGKYFKFLLLKLISDFIGILQPIIFLFIYY